MQCKRGGADLFRAKQYVEESEKLVERQKQLLTKLRKEGRPVEKAEAILSMLESGCLQMRNYVMMLTASTWHQNL
jgi:hypothetical protein